jgi:hypothetical protein
VNRHTKRWAAGIAVLAIAGLAAMGAYAYFSATGSGTASANVGSSSAVTLSGSTTGNLYPDGPARDVAITITNPSSGAQYVNKVHLASVDPSDAGCDATAFGMPDVTVQQMIAGGGNLVVHGSLSMADNGANQDDCQGNSLTLNLTSN